MLCSFRQDVILVSAARLWPAFVVILIACMVFSFCAIFLLDHYVAGLGGWNGTGCHLMEDIGTQVTCRCSHLTNFAILLTPNIVETQVSRVILIVARLVM